MHCRLLAIALIIPCFTLGTAVAEDDAKAIIERAIKVRAPNPALLKKQSVMIMKFEGKIFGNPETPFPALREQLAEWPNSFRFSIEYETPDGKKGATMAMQGDQGWQRAHGGPVLDLNFNTSDSFRDEFYGRWIAALYPLRDTAYTFTMLKDSKVADEEASVVKATRVKRPPDLNLYFSKKSGHLLKISYMTQEGGKECRKEHVFSDFKDFDGLVLPTKMQDYVQYGIRPNTKMGDWTITSYQFPEKLPPDTFERPDKKK